MRVARESGLQDIDFTPRKYRFTPAIRGLRPIHVHIRVDFMILATNQLLNMVSNYTYSTGGKLKVPLVVRAVIGRGWGQGAQHSKSLFSNFTHIRV